VNSPQDSRRSQQLSSLTECRLLACPPCLPGRRQTGRQAGCRLLAACCLYPQGLNFLRPACISTPDMLELPRTCVLIEAFPCYRVVLFLFEFAVFITQKCHAPLRRPLGPHPTPPTSWRASPDQTAEHVALVAATYEIDPGKLSYKFALIVTVSWVYTWASTHGGDCSIPR
jgi:hypothetical protein